MRSGIFFVIAYDLILFYVVVGVVKEVTKLQARVDEVSKQSSLDLEEKYRLKQYMNKK